MADTPATVRVADNARRHRYEAFVDGTVAAYATYDLTPGVINFLHTKTDPAFEGHGVGSALAAAALDDARARQLRVVATCPFFADYIDRHPAYADLLAGGG